MAQTKKELIEKLRQLEIVLAAANEQNRQVEEQRKRLKGLLNFIQGIGAPEDS